MKNRCTYPRNVAYKWYGAKGIRVCSAWDNFVHFREWALSHGYEEGLQLDRIDSSKDYAPENCRWVTPRRNAINRSAVKLTILDVMVIKKMLADGFRAFLLARLYNVSPSSIGNIKKGRAWQWVETA
jgi:hypothetical protein